MTSHVSRRSA